MESILNTKYGLFHAGVSKVVVNMHLSISQQGVPTRFGVEHCPSEGVPFIVSGQE